jgi:hypothetical protein
MYEMPSVGVLFSGGKDSALSAILLRPFFDVELVTITFGINDSWKFAMESARGIGFAWRKKKLPKYLLKKAVEIIIRDGFPRNGLNYIHKESLRHLAEEYDFIADGTRRDDVSPKLTVSEIASLEMSCNVGYITPLMGYGRKTLDTLVKKYLLVEEGESEIVNKSDYESEIREYLRKIWSEELIYELFPTHIQSRVVGLKDQVITNGKEDCGSEEKAG